MKIHFDDYRRNARRRLPCFVFDCVDGGAENETCLHCNICDLVGIHLLPTVFRDSSKADTSIIIFGQSWSSPVGVSPVGFACLVRPHGDVMLAHAAAETGIPHVLSTPSNDRLKVVRAAALERNPAVVQWMQLYVMGDRSISEELAWLRRLWDGPLIVKQLLHPGDAKHALTYGADAIVVSNQGERQLDAVSSTISVLLRVVYAVARRIPVFIDSGFRRGSDVVKAIAVGATAAFVICPADWGMATDAEAGAHDVLVKLSAEISRTMAFYCRQ